MKKLCLVLLFVLLFSTVWGIAEGIDLSGMSFEELQDLRDRIDDELYSRKDLGEELLTEGNYLVGDTIEAGQYIITAKEVYFYRNTVTHYSNTDGKGLEVDFGTLNVLEDFYLMTDEQCRVKLEDGEILKIDDGVSIMRKIK